MSEGPREAPLAPEACARLLGVEEERLDRLRAHLHLLSRWQPRINLVASSTLRDPWRRHYLDCGQLLRHLPPGVGRVVDLGSGAGFPGLVLAILRDVEVHLVEADQRKAAFLREAARITGAANVTVHARRIEELPPFSADAVVARALAPLPELLRYAHRFFGPHTLGLFLKGASLRDELTRAREHWRMRAELRESLSSAQGRILIVRDLEPTHAGAP